MVRSMLGLALQMVATLCLNLMMKFLLNLTGYSEGTHHITLKTNESTLMMKSKLLKF